MNTEQPSKFNIALKWGGIGALLFVIVGMFQYLMDIVSQAFGTISSIAILTLAIVMAIKAYKAVTGGYASYGQGFSTGMLTSLVISGFMLVWTFLFYDVIAPDFKEKILAIATQSMSDRGMDADQIEQTMESAAFFFSTAWFAIVGVISIIIMGLIISAITAAVMKNEAPAHEILDA